VLALSAGKGKGRVPVSLPRITVYDWFFTGSEYMPP
jgi:hypothetical protein